jgi:hypothetical protein
MKTVKLKVKSEDDNPDEEIELSFNDAEIEKLQMFMENFRRFEGARLIENGIPEVKNIKFTNKEGLSFEFTEFDYRDVYELLHLARPIFLVKEPASFEKTCAILGMKGKGTALAQHLKYLRNLYEKGEYQSLFQISIGSSPLFHENTLRDWLYGGEYHQDEDKRDRIQELENALTKETARGIFVSQLSGRIKATFEVAHVVNLILEKVKTDMLFKR